MPSAARSCCSALAELKHRDDVPTKVVINEGVELAKRYGAAESFKFVNAVLDKTARELRRSAGSRPKPRHDRRVRDHRALLHAARSRSRRAARRRRRRGRARRRRAHWPSRSTRSSRACTFPTALPPNLLGYRLMAVNLSDLAAMGAEPRWCTLALTLPKPDERWLEGFSRGLFELADAYGVSLVGGDLTRGPLTVTLQLMGARRARPRAHARRRQGRRRRLRDGHARRQRSRHRADHRARRGGAGLRGGGAEGTLLSARAARRGGPRAALARERRDRRLGRACSRISGTSASAAAAAR